LGEVGLSYRLGERPVFDWNILVYIADFTLIWELTGPSLLAGQTTAHFEPET